MRCFLPTLLSFCVGVAGAAEWIVAPQGDDQRAGSASAPLATLGAAVAKAQSGDRIRLAAGGTYRIGTLTIGEGITVTRIGDGPAPEITASESVELVTPWTTNPKVRTTRVAKRVLACWMDGRFLPLARFPNADAADPWLRTGEGTTPDRIVDPVLGQRKEPAVGRWTGAQVRWRRWSWWWETRAITSDTVEGLARILALGPDNKFHDPFTGIGSAYYIDDCLAELDAPGEWCWHDGTLYVYPHAPVAAESAKPVTKKKTAANAAVRVEIVISTDGLTCEGGTLEGVALRCFAGTALRIGKPSTVRSCQFDTIDDTAIAGTWDAGGTIIADSVFSDIHNTAITWNGNPGGKSGTVISGSRFERIGMREGYGGSGSWHSVGVTIVNGNQVQVRDNRFRDIGYAGILFGGAGQTAERNVLVRCMATMNDGAAIYTNCNASIIRHNIILDTVGNLATSHPFFPLGHGIWPEFLSNFRDTVIEGNIICGSNGNGIFFAKSVPRSDHRQHLPRQSPRQPAHHRRRQGHSRHRARAYHHREYLRSFRPSRA